MLAVLDVRWENTAAAYPRVSRIIRSGTAANAALGGLGDAGATYDDRIEVSGEIVDTGDVSLAATDGTSLYGLSAQVRNGDAVARNVTAANLHVALIPMDFAFTQVYP